MKHKRGKPIMTIMRCLATTVATLILFVPNLHAQDKPEASYMLIKNVSIFDGVNNRLTPGDVLIENNLINAVGAIEKVPQGTRVIDGGGRTLMPGMIDCHSHLGAQMGGVAALEGANWDEIAARTVIAAKDHLMDGFTTVRDLGGMSGRGIKKMIDADELPGPRIFPSGAIISQTSGHGDLSTLSTRPYRLNGGIRDSNIERLEISVTADGRADVLAAVRRQLKTGATQIKIMAGGGVASTWDPWHSTGYTLDEMKAAVEAAADYGTYVAAHVNQNYSIQRCLEAGIPSIEHGFVLDEKTISMIVEKGAFLSTQLTGTSRELYDLPSLNAENLRKLDIAQEEMKDYFRLVKKHKPKQVFSIDAVLTTKKQADQQRAHEIWLFAHHFGNFAMLKAATSTAGELVALCGKMNPYPLGKLGVVEEGAYADIILVDGNPLEDISTIGGNELWYKAPSRDGVETIPLIIKDGKICKNTLGQESANHDH
jgi:imidazolonepropionase-like amidohydrolase